MKNQASAKGKEEDPCKVASHGGFSLLHRSLWLIIFSGAIFFLGLYHCTAAAPALESRPEPSFILDNAERTTLDNGMVLLVKENHDVPLVSLFLCVLTGGAHEAEFSGTGISHFIEHMVFKGTSQREAGEVFKEIAAYGGNITAFTSHDYSGYEITVPAEFVRSALEILADMATNATFDQEELKKERQVILKEIKLNRDDPQRYASRLLWQTAYSQHSYKYPIIGEEDLFKDLSREDLLEFYQSRYTYDNMILAVVGDIVSEETPDLVRDIFKDSRRKSVERFESEPEPKQKQLRQKEEEFTSGLTYLLLGYHSVALTDEDCFALDVLATILGEGQSSRLYKSACDKKSLAYSVGAVNYTPRDPGLFIISTLLEEPNRQRLLRLIFSQINQLKKKQVSEKELEGAKNKIISDILFLNQTFGAQARDLVLNEAVAGDFKFSEKYIRKIRQVTSENILEVANKYLKRNNLNIVALTPRPGSANTNLPKELSKSFKIGVENLSRENNQPRSIDRYVLENGLRVLIKENKALPLVSIKAVFKGGLRAEKENLNGLSNLVAQMLDKGTKTKNALEIAEVVESKGARLSYFSANNSFGISLDSMSKDFDEMLTLLADLIINPVFRQSEFRKQKKKNLALLETQEDNIFEVGIKQLKLLLFEKHPYRYMSIGRKESLRNIKRRNLKDFHRKFCVGRNMVLAIFGDVDAEEAAIKVKDIFAKLDAGQPYDVAIPEEPSSKNLRSSFKALPKKQSLLLLGFGGTTVFDQDRYALELISQVLSHPSGKLFSQIRGKEGLAYTLGAYQVLGLDPGYIVVYVATTAENVKTAKLKILHQLQLLKEEPLSEEELRQAKKALIGEKLIARQTNSACAMESSLDELYGLGYDYYLKYTEMIEAVEAEDIRRCADQYFDLNNYAVAVVGPQI